MSAAYFVSRRIVFVASRALFLSELSPLPRARFFMEAHHDA